MCSFLSAFSLKCVKINAIHPLAAKQLATTVQTKTCFYSSLTQRTYKVNANIDITVFHHLILSGLIKLPYPMKIAPEIYAAVSAVFYTFIKFKLYKNPKSSSSSIKIVLYMNNSVATI